MFSVILLVFLETVAIFCPTGGTVVSNINQTGVVPIPNSPYWYEAWTDAHPPSTVTEGQIPANFTLTIRGVDADGQPTAAFRAEWRKSSDFLARVGLQLDEGKNYTDYGPIKAEYAYTRIPYTCVPIEGQANKCVDDGAAGDYSYIGVYGWTRDPLIEYYIVDDWFGNPYDQINGDSVNVGEGTVCYDYISQGKTCYVGKFTVDGSEYKVYNHRRTDAFTIDGVGDFDQYYSLRQDPRKCGTISITEHFKAWESLGLPLGTLYEAQLLVEAGGGIGWIDYTHAAVKANIPDKCDPKSDDHYQFPGCTLKPCTSRRKNSIDPSLPCGPDCYWDAGATDNLLKCIESATPCTNSDLYEKKEDSHSCGLKPPPPQDPEPSGSSIATVNIALLLLAVFWLTFG